jgi:hypothetical protein
VRGLVQADLARTWDPQSGDPAPTLLLDPTRERGAPGLELADRCLEVVTHEVDLVSACRAAVGVHRQLGWGQLEYEPASSRGRSGSSQKMIA